MPSSQSILSCANLALLNVGSRAQISNLNEGSTQADAVNLYFQFVYESLARTARWGCLKKQATLSLLQAAQGTSANPTGTTLPIPQQPWLYGYLYPPDALFIRAIICPNNTSAGPTEPQLAINNTTTPWVPEWAQIPYEIAYSTDSLGNPLQIILTNQVSALANYTVNQPNPANWDSLFTNAYVASLAAYLASALTQNAQLMQSQAAVAEKFIKQAQAIDGNESPTSQSRLASWTKARSGATGWFGGLPGFNGFGPITNNMCWPW